MPLWARACGVRWAVLQDRFRRSRTTLNRDYRGALATLAQAERKANAAAKGWQPVPDLPPGIDAADLRRLAAAAFGTSGNTPMPAADVVRRRPWCV